MLEHGDLDDKAHIVSELQGKVLMLSQHKFARYLTHISDNILRGRISGYISHEFAQKLTLGL